MKNNHKEDRWRREERKAEKEKDEVQGGGLDAVGGHVVKGKRKSGEERVGGCKIKKKERSFKTLAL